MWRIEGAPSWRNARGAYAVTVYVHDDGVTNVVTDPCSLGLTLDSCRRAATTSPVAYMRPLLGEPALEPRPADIRAARDRAAELLRIRFSSPLFRLGSAREIQRRVRFPTGGREQAPGVIVMAIEGRESIVVVFNAPPTKTTQTVPTEGRYALHPVQAHGGDSVVKRATASRGAFTVPARTTAVFVSRRR